MQKPEKNPFAKATFNLTEQGRIYQSDPELCEVLRKEAVLIDQEDERRKKTRTLSEFNQLDRAGKIQFLHNGGTVVSEL